MNTIKKVMMALTIALAACGIAQASPISFGVKAGMNVNKLKFNKDVVNSDNSCGWTAGVMADFTVPIIGVGCDVSLMYSRMNNSSDVTGLLPAVQNPGLTGAAEATSSSSNNLYGKNFLEIPINLKYKLTLPAISRLVKPYVFTGPSFAFRLDKSSISEIYDLKSKSCQINWNVGLGVELVNHVQVGASYGFGINNIVEPLAKDKINITSDIKAKNNYWTISAAYLF